SQVESRGVACRQSGANPRIFQPAGEWMLRGQPIVEDDRQIARFGKLHPELSKRGRAAERPAAAMQVDRPRMRTCMLRHRDVGAKAGAQLDVFLECADGGEVLIVN